MIIAISVVAIAIWFFTSSPLCIGCFSASLMVMAIFAGETSDYRLPRWAFEFMKAGVILMLAMIVLIISK